MSRKESLTSLRDHLQNQPRQRLVDVLVALAEESEPLRHRIRLLTLDEQADLSPHEARRIIQSSIDSYADRHGFVAYGRVGRAVHGAMLVMQRAGQVSGWRRFDLGQVVFEAMVDLLQTADDSDGTIGGLIEESLERLSESLAQVPGGDRPALVRRILDMAVASRLNGWSDWQIRLLHEALRHIDTSHDKAAWDQAVKHIMAHDRESDWSHDYTGEKIALMEHAWLAARDAAAAEAFVHQHVHYPAFRTTLIEAALAVGAYDDALRLAAEGEVRDAGRGPGVVRTWKEWRLRIAQRSGRRALTVQVARELVEAGDFAYYGLLKSNCPAEEWPALYQRLLETLARDVRGLDVYPRILVAERETARLADYVKAHPYTLERYYRALLPDHREEVRMLFTAHIEQLSARAQTRSAYQDVGRSVRLLREACGDAAAADVVQSLIRTYSRRPAFREELTKALGPMPPKT